MQCASVPAESSVKRHIDPTAEARRHLADAWETDSDRLRLVARPRRHKSIEHQWTDGIRYPVARIERQVHASMLPESSSCLRRLSTNGNYGKECKASWRTPKSQNHNRRGHRCPSQETTPASSQFTRNAGDASTSMHNADTWQNRQPAENETDRASVNIPE